MQSMIRAASRIGVWYFRAVQKVQQLLAIAVITLLAAEPALAQLPASDIGTPAEDLVPATKVEAGAANAASLQPAVTDAIKVNRSVRYAGSNVGTEHIQADCDWNTLLIDHLVKDSKGTIEVTDEDLNAVPGRTLLLAIIATNPESDPRGGYRTGRVVGQLRDNGQVIDQFDITKYSNGAFQFTTCNTLEKIAKELAESLARQLAREPAGAKANPAGAKHPDAPGAG